MESHEVIKIELEGTRQRVAGALETSNTQKAFSYSNSKPTSRVKTIRGWDGFDVVTTIAGHGVELRWSGVFMAVLPLEYF